MINSFDAKEQHGIHEWKPSDKFHNFGDHLMLLLGEKIFEDNSWKSIQESQNCRFVLLGSFLCDWNLKGILEKGFKPVLVGSGYRGEILSGPLACQATYYGCRGRHTQDALASIGIDVNFIGDPAMLLPTIVPRPLIPSGKIIFMPHINDPARLSYTRSNIGFDEIIQPETKTTLELVRIIKTISTARFVLAGAMHAAIVAHAYGVPFAFFSTESGYVDCPPKWADWLSSISTPIVQPSFFPNITSGTEWYENIRNQLTQNNYMPILDAYANLGKLKKRVIFKAAIRDAIKAYRAISGKTVKAIGLQNPNSSVDINKSYNNRHHDKDNFENDCSKYNKNKI